MSAALFSLADRDSHAVEIRKSRFLAQAASVTSVDEAVAFVHEVSRVEASHHCWAWRVGQDYRFHDDGEPSGSAGKPILAAIDGQRLDRTVVVVTRWFGGTKLGVGGLMRAYGGTAATCLRQAHKLPIIRTTAAVLVCAYADLALIQSRLDALQATIQGQRFEAATVTLQLSLPDQHLDTLRQLVADVTRGRGRLRAQEA